MKSPAQAEPKASTILQNLEKSLRTTTCKLRAAKLEAFS